MLERRKIGVEKMKNENEVDLKSGEEIERAFRNRLERTFRISEEENLVRGMKEWWMSGSDRRLIESEPKYSEVIWTLGKGGRGRAYERINITEIEEVKRGGVPKRRQSKGA